MMGPNDAPSLNGILLMFVMVSHDLLVFQAVHRWSDDTTNEILIIVVSGLQDPLPGHFNEAVLM